MWKLNRHTFGKIHMNKERALRQIDDIYQTMKGSFRAIISGSYMIAVGCAITMIPVMEMAFSVTLDPMLIGWGGSWGPPLIFMTKTLFYWALFMGIAYSFAEHARTKALMHPVLKKIWSLGSTFPIVPIAMAAVMAQCGYAGLVIPIVLILVGCLYALFGQFSSYIVTVVAWSYILGGLAGIYLSTLQITHLWKYLVVFQGIGIIIMGLVLAYEQRIAAARE
jgi:hypothetical protein